MTEASLMDNNDQSRAVKINTISLKIPIHIFPLLGLPLGSDTVSYESEITSSLKSCLRSGDIFFDIWSSYGITTALMSKWVGKQGTVFAFESDRKLIEISKKIFEINNLENNVRIPDSDPMNFNFLDFCKDNKIYPNCIKLEISDQKSVNIKAVGALLDVYSPNIVLKVNKSKTSETEETGKFFEHLDEENYSLFDLQLGTILKGYQFVGGTITNTSYFLISKKLSDEFVKHLKENIIPEIRQSRTVGRAEFDINEIRQLINSQKYLEVIKRISLTSFYGYDAEIQYYLALSLQITNQNDTEVLLLYDAALTGGFDPFWIYYNRSALYHKMGDLQNAVRDLKHAYDLDPNHEGVLTMMKMLNVKDFS